MAKRFKGEIQPGPSGGAFVIIPFDVEKELGSKRPKVKATFDGVSYRGTLVRMGMPEHILLVRKDVRSKIGKGPGDTVEVTIGADTEPRVVKAPPDLMSRFEQNPQARALFDELSYTSRREYVAWIEGAKKPDTRERRLAKTIEGLLEGKRTP